MTGTFRPGSLLFEIEAALDHGIRAVSNHHRGGFGQSLFGLEQSGAIRIGHFPTVLVRHPYGANPQLRKAQAIQTAVNLLDQVAYGYSLLLVDLCRLSLRWKPSKQFAWKLWRSTGLSGHRKEEVSRLGPSEANSVPCFDLEVNDFLPQRS